MSDPKRANLITVGATKSAKINVNKTVRLTINLDESNESKYPELNYKELVIAEERKKRVQNGKTGGLDPFSDNDDDVERVARKFEQKYGGKSTYGRKGRSKQDDFADIGAGYDENDSFIDNTHGYDEMIPPECDTFHGGFYINCGSLEFKTVPQDQANNSDDNIGGRRNKRRISSSSSEDESSDSSSESESQDEKDPKVIANGAVDSHNTEHRKKKNKKTDKSKPNKIRRTDSSAATSGKQTSDDNVHGDGESADSRTSQSDSVTSKPAPSSENAVTSDSSRDVESKTSIKLPAVVTEALEALETSVAKHAQENPTTPAKQLVALNEHYLLRLEQIVKSQGSDPRLVRAVRTRAARALAVPRAKLVQRIKAVVQRDKQAHTQSTSTSPPATSTTTTASTTTAATTTTTNNKRKHVDNDSFDVTKMTEEEREAKIVDTLQRLKQLIDERKPGMIANYNAECERVQEERKKLQIASGGSGSGVERRLPKRRFPWCSRSRQLLARLTRLAGPAAGAAAPPAAGAAAPPAAGAAALLAARVLPLFPAGFVRMPTLLRQADLSKDIKVTEMKRQRLGSASQLQNQPQPVTNPNTANQSAQQIQFPEPINFPSSLTITATVKTSPDKEPTQQTNKDDKHKGNSTNYKESDDKFKGHSVFGSIVNSFTLSKDLIVEKEKKDDKKEDLYIPPNNIGSITITPVINKEKKSEKQSLIRVKSPAALNEMAKKEAKSKKPEKITNSHKEKRVDSPLHIDTNFHPKHKDPSPKTKDESTQKQTDKSQITQKHIENLRTAENNIPRPALVPVSHSPTFAKPDKRPPDLKKKKEIVIMSDLDPLADNQEPVAIDDSSSDVEVIESDKSVSEVPLNVKNKKVSVSVPKKDDDAVNEDIDTLMRNIREMEHSQEPTKFNSNSFGGVITTGVPKNADDNWKVSIAKCRSKIAQNELL